MDYDEQNFHPLPPGTGLSVQQRISPRWLAQLTLGFTNSLVVVLVPGTLCARELDRTFGCLVQRHGALRTSYTGHAEGMKGRLTDPRLPPVAIETVDDGPAVDDASGLLERYADWAYEAPDLAQDCQLAYRAVQVRGDYGLVLMRVPHFVSDGYSKRLLFYDFSVIYQGMDGSGEQSAPAESYDSYVRRQGDALKEGSWNESIAYWQGLYENWPQFVLPTQYGERIPGRIETAFLFAMSEQEIRALSVIANEAGCSAEFAINIILAIGLARWSGTDRILMPLVARGRSTVEDHEAIGLFALSVALPVNCQGPTFIDVLREAFQFWAKLSEGGGLPGAIGMAHVGKGEASPLFTNIMIDLSRSGALKCGGLENIPFNVEPTNALYDEAIYIVALGSNSGVQSLMYYSTGSANAQGAAALSEVLRETISSIISSKGRGAIPQVGRLDPAI